MTILTFLVLCENDNYGPALRLKFGLSAINRAFRKPNNQRMYLKTNLDPKTFPSSANATMTEDHSIQNQANVICGTATTVDHNPK